MDADAYFVPAGSGKHRDLSPGVSIAATAGESMLFSVVTMQAGATVPEHSHHHEQMGLLVSGRLRFTVGGVTRELGPGDIWRIPGGVVHSVETVEGPAVALDVFHPIREDYL